MTSRRLLQFDPREPIKIEKEKKRRDQGESRRFAAFRRLQSRAFFTAREKGTFRPAEAFDN